jgi:hypothetical protein
MKKLGLICILTVIFTPVFSQKITSGRGIEALKLGQTYEEVVEVLGFKGKLKTYDEYLAEELFSTDPKDALECAIGFDYYVRYEYLLTLPISYAFFKDNRLVQIMVSSIPQYYHALARDVQTEKGLRFWSEAARVEQLYGPPAVQKQYPDFILNTMFYLDNGIAMQVRDDLYRSVHIFEMPSQDIAEQFRGNVQ